MRPLLLFLKANTPSGARWITVHPGGNQDAKGVPVLIQETSKGSGVHRVIGGAGGNLNFLKLHGVKSEGEYKEQAKQRSKDKREAKKLQRKRDKELGVDKAKTEAKKAVKEQVTDKEREFIQTVAKTMDWKPEDIRFPEEKYEGVSFQARNKALQEHKRRLLKKAEEAVDLQHQRLLHDAEARAQALGEVPLEAADPSELSVQDLDPVKPEGAGLGYATKYRERAEKQGATEESLKEETETTKEREQPEERREAIKKRKETVERIGKELEGIQEQPFEAKAQLVDPKQAAELLKARKQLQAIRKKAREATKEIEGGESPKGAYILEVGKEHLDEDLAEDLSNDLKTLKTRAFLSEIQKHGGDQALGRHIGVGSYNAINALSLTTSGQGLMDRDVVDVLGVAGAAQAVARRLHSDLTKDEIEDIADALQEYHVEHYLEQSDQAIRQAIDLQQAADGIEIDQAVNTQDLARVQELNAKRMEAINEANRILGTSLGEFETNAALIMALKQGPKDTYTIPLGDVSVEDAIIRARAIGLQRGDYQIEKAGKERILTVTGAGMDRLTQPVNREDLQAIQDSMDIIEGRKDEDDWLPEGIARRPDLAMEIPPGSAPRLAEPFDPGEDLEQSIRDYIGGRTADGDPPADIVADLLSEGMMSKVSDRQAYLDALDRVMPRKDDKGRNRPADSYREEFSSMADDFAMFRHGTTRGVLNSQQIALDDKSVDALHRALSQVPEGVSAFKPIGDLTSKDQRVLRDHFIKNYQQSPERAGEIRRELKSHIANEPEKKGTGTTDFTLDTLNQDLQEHLQNQPDKSSPEYAGWLKRRVQLENEIEDASTSEAWKAWRRKKTALQRDLDRAELDWPKYVRVMGGRPNAYKAMQDFIRSSALRAFHAEHNRLHHDNLLKLGIKSVHHNISHLSAIDPDLREKRLAQTRSDQAKVRQRSGGKFAQEEEGAVIEGTEQLRAAREAAKQSQFGLFGGEEPDPLPQQEAEKEKPLDPDQRHTLGHAAERQLAGMMNTVGKNFKPGEPLRLWQPSMNGKFAPQQRAVKYIERNKKAVLAAGVGSGKTLIGLGAFTHLHSQGKAHRGMFVVPSIVQSQFQGEALRYLEPGKYQWHAEPGAPREERLKAYRDPANHFVVVTHQALRDDMIHLGARHAGIDEGAMADRLQAMTPEQQKTWTKEIMDREGIDHDYMMIDEFHDTLSRKGKADSRMANVLTGMFHNAEHGVLSSADPVKNDASEIWSALNKVAPDRYPDRDAFLRRYGVDTQSAKEQLRREMSRHIFPSKVDAGVKSTRREETVQLSDGQQRSLKELDGAIAKARVARMSGKMDIDAARHLWPQAFEGVDPARHGDVAKHLLENLPIVRDQAVQRIINTHADSAKTEHVSKLVDERRGKPGVVFAHNRAAVKQIAERLQKEGHRVVTITGEDSAKEKHDKRMRFRPESGEPEADILVASDAASVGLNAQRGEWLIQYDTPDTGMRHAQRNGRIERLGQKKDIELIDLVADHPVERKARRRLATKYQLRQIMTSPMEGLDDKGFAGYLQRAKMQKAEPGLF